MPIGAHQWIQLSECIAAVYLMFRGACVTIHNMCVWIMVKFNGAEEKKS